MFSRELLTSGPAFDELINYRDQTTMPDTITVLLLSCAGYNAVNMMGCVGQIGTQAMFDDVTLTDITGFQYLPDAGGRSDPITQPGNHLYRFQP